jgi:hypothetical protein
MFEEKFTARKCGVKDFDIETLFSQMGTEIKDAEWGVELHDLKLFGILVNEITVRK